MALFGLTESAWNLVGVFLGVIAGQVLTMWWDRRKQASQRAEFRERTVRSIARELEQIRENVAQVESTRVPDVAYPTGAYRSSVSSGRFALLDADDQLAISELYGTIERAEQDQQQLRQTRLDSGADEDYVRQLQFQFDDRLEALETEIPDVITQLQDDGRTQHQ